MIASPRFAPFALAAALAFAGAAPAQEGTAEEQIRRGIALHDQGNYPGAIKIYRELLERDPKNALALYELAFSLNAGGDYAECAAVAEPALRHAKTHRRELYRVAASCYDHAGQIAKAVATFKKGRREFPEDWLLAYNFAVTLFQQERLPEAREMAKIALNHNPGHASSCRVLAFAYQSESNDVPALLAALRFLSLEPTSARAPEVADLAREMLAGNSRQTGEKEIQIVIPQGAPTTEGDFQVVSTFLGVLSATRFLPEPGKTESEKFAGMVGRLLEFLAEEPEIRKLDEVVAARLIEPLVGIQKAGLAETFGFLAFYSLDLEGGRAWLEEHAESREKLVKLLRASA